MLQYCNPAPALSSGCSAYVPARVPAPKLRLEGTGLWVQFTLRKHPRTPVKTPVETLVKSSVKTSEKSSWKTIDHIRRNPTITIPELAGMLGVTTRAIDKQIALLKKRKALRRIGPAKGGYWEVLHK